MNLNDLGKFIAKMRKEKRITQEQLAEKLKVHPKTVSKWERGVTAPDICLLKPLSEEFGISVDELIKCKEKKYGIEKNVKYYFSKFKLNYIKLSLIGFLIVISVFLLIIGIIKYNDFHLYEAFSTNDNYLVKGYVGFNYKKSMIFIDYIYYNDKNDGTDKELKVKKVNITLGIGEKELVTSSISTDEGEETMSLDQTLKNVEFSINNEKLNNNSLNKLYIYISYVDEDDNEYHNTINFRCIELK